MKLRLWGEVSETLTGVCRSGWWCTQPVSSSGSASSRVRISRPSGSSPSRESNRVEAPALAAATARLATPPGLMAKPVANTSAPSSGTSAPAKTRSQ